MEYSVGQTIQIIKMNGEPQYSNRRGKITLIDDFGHLHGTWGGLAVVPAEDEIIVLEE